ncbi:MAG: ribosome biogenesis GTPase Der [Oscillospiraceae bacterium]|jgi:GTP-binding protein|nr:ribosome biogenesis GTPase Der [Oscillospiraceae bacterium]
MAVPVVAIVGRPNVGKSSLFNRLVGRNKAITLDMPGVTRDRIYGDCSWRGKNISVVDTGGLEVHPEELLKGKVRQQVMLAVEEADAVILVVDLKIGVTNDDLEIAGLLKKTTKSVVVAVNKCDFLGAPEPEFYEFYSLGFNNLIEISSIHGHGIGELLDLVWSNVEFENDASVRAADVLRVAVIGKPNVGKSSLVNCIAKKDQVLVSEIAGTTRDSTDTLIENEEGSFVFVDTAGLRKRGKVGEDLEYFSVRRALKSINNADVCLMLIDAQEGPSEQDSKIVGYAHEQGKALIAVINKWDLVNKTENTTTCYKSKLHAIFSFIPHLTCCFVSAKTGLGIGHLFVEIKQVFEQTSRRLTTGALNVMLAEAIEKAQPPSRKGKPLKIYYITQIGVKPPTFVLFVNNRELLHFSYERYLENQIREVFDLKFPPIRFVVRERTRTGRK